MLTQPIAEEIKQFMKKPRIRLIQSTLETANIFSEIKLQLKNQELQFR